MGAINGHTHIVEWLSRARYRIHKYFLIYVKRHEGSINFCRADLDVKDSHGATPIDILAKHGKSISNSELLPYSTIRHAVAMKEVLGVSTPPPRHVPQVIPLQQALPI